MNKDDPRPMNYSGFCDHDCESHHTCPVCKEDYGSWYFFHQGLKHGDIFKCLKCGQKLVVPD